MDGTKLQSKVYGGYAKAASVVGLPFDVYRMPALDEFGPLAPVVTGDYKVASGLPAQFTLNSGSMAFQTAPKPKDVLYDALVDGRRVRPGDVLVNASAGTFFILSMRPLLPIKAVRCNNTVTITRRKQVASDSVGAVGYSGAYPTPTDPGVDAIFSDVPCAIVTEGIGRVVSQGMLPGDSPGPTKWLCYLPPYIGQGKLFDRDLVTDAQGVRYQVAAAFWGQDGYLAEITRQQT